jgi:DNA-binding MarR family transcriptional regulator
MEAQIIAILDELTSHLRGAIWRAAEPLGLNPAQAKILQIMAIYAEDEKSLTLSELAKKLQISPASCSDSVKALKNKNLVLQSEYQHDSRIKILALTPEGKRAVSNLQSYTNELHANLQEMHMSEKAMLLDGLKALKAKI